MTTLRFTVQSRRGIVASFVSKPEAEEYASNRNMSSETDTFRVVDAEQFPSAE